MHEIRIKPKTLTVAIAVVTFLLVMLIMQRSKCDPGNGARPAAPLAIVYAITPTYARPVQKAELTR